MQAAEATKQRNKLCRRVQVLSLLAYVATGGLMFLSYQKQIDWLREEIPTTADELVVFCRQTEGLRPEQLRIVRPVCRVFDTTCRQETQGGAAGAYEACFRREATAEFAGSQNRIVRGANRAWALLRWFVFGTCFLSTLVQWYCGVFAANIANNIFLVGCYILFNAIFAGYWGRIYVDGNPEDVGSWILLPGIVLHLVAAYYASFLLMKQAQVSALAPDLTLSDQPVVNIEVQNSSKPNEASGAVAMRSGPSANAAVLLAPPASGANSLNP